MIKSPNSHLLSTLHSCWRNKCAVLPCSKDRAIPAGMPRVLRVPQPLLLLPPSWQGVCPPGAGLQPSLAPAPPGRSESTAPLGSPRGSVSCQGQDNTPGHTQPFPLAQLPKELINTENRVCF